MIHAYDEIYLERARTVMAHMLDYAVHVLGYGVEEFFKEFLVSDICSKFERGQASVIAGKSGTELALEIMDGELMCEEQWEENAFFRNRCLYFRYRDLQYV